MRSSPSILSMIEPAWTKMRCLTAWARAIVYAGPPGRVSALASLSAFEPPAQSKNSGKSTQSGRSSLTARSISASAAAMLAALSLIEFIWMIETFMGVVAPAWASLCSAPAGASTSDEGSEGLELVGDDAARRRIGQFALRVDLLVDLGD